MYAKDLPLMVVITRNAVYVNERIIGKITV